MIKGRRSVTEEIEGFQQLLVRNEGKAQMYSLLYYSWKEVRENELINDCYFKQPYLKLFGSKDHDFNFNCPIVSTIVPNK